MSRDHFLPSRIHRVFVGLATLVLAFSLAGCERSIGEEGEKNSGNSNSGGGFSSAGGSGGGSQAGTETSSANAGAGWAATCAVACCAGAQTEGRSGQQSAAPSQTQPRVSPIQAGQHDISCEPVAAEAPATARPAAKTSSSSQLARFRGARRMGSGVDAPEGGVKPDASAKRAPR